ncbi:MAG: hypothetical protein IT439_06060 [Phycisphaerales bacterium]|nr:hypothetical protein [Phycisphaerales bacterium]
MDCAELIRFQLAHSTWAIGEIIRHARTLPPGAIEENLGIGPGSLRENIAHTVEAMLFFGENFAGRDFDPARYTDVSRCSATLDGLAELLSIASARLAGSVVPACERGLPDRVMWPNAEHGRLPAPAALAQVFDHSTLHRAQCVNMLKRLGVSPVPDLDPMTFCAAGLPW